VVAARNCQACIRSPSPRTHLYGLAIAAIADRLGMHRTPTVRWCGLLLSLCRCGRPQRGKHQFASIRELPGGRQRPGRLCKDRVKPVRREHWHHVTPVQTTESILPDQNVLPRPCEVRALFIVNRNKILSSVPKDLCNISWFSRVPPTTDFYVGAAACEYINSCYRWRARCV
jgi:hypothetical protein